MHCNPFSFVAFIAEYLTIRLRADSQRHAAELTIARRRPSSLIVLV